MAYVGNTPTTQSFIEGTDYFNGDGSTTAFTLSRTVVSPNDVMAVINNVVQQPNSAYTISGTTITFTSAPSAGTSNIYVRYMSTTTQSITPSQNTVSYNTLNSDNQSKLGISFKNRIINGACAIDQRYAGASTTATGYLIDRWYTGSVAGATLTNQQVTDAPTGFLNSLKTTVTVSSTTSDYNFNAQVIEANNAYDFAWGTSSGQTVTLSFWIKSSLTGTVNGLIRYYGPTNYYYLPQYTINAANTWEYKTLTIPAPPTAAGAYASSLTSGYALFTPFTMITSGYASTTAANTWSSTAVFKATGSTINFPSNAAATVQFTGVQLEVGTQATTFDYRDFGRELILCQRYYEKNYNQDTPVGSSAPSVDSYSRVACSSRYSGTTYGSIPYKVIKRANPTVSFWKADGTANLWSAYSSGGSTGTLTPTSNDGGQYNLNLFFPSSTSFDLVQGYWAASAEL